MAHAEVEERQLLKAMTWWDGFVIALANPGFLIAALGASIGALGTTGAFVLWTISVLIGALQNNVYAEIATMFQDKPGGIALYAHEAWRKYFTLRRPDRDVRLLVRVVERARDQRPRGRNARRRRSSSRTATWTEYRRRLPPQPGDRIGIGAIILVWLFNIRGVRPAVWLSYVTGGRADHPCGGADVPAVCHRRLVERQHDLGDRLRRWPRPGAHLAVLHGVVGLRLRVRGGVRSGVPQPGGRHAKGLRAVSRVLGRRLRAAAARPRRHARPGGRSRRTAPSSPSTRPRSTRSSAAASARS